MWWTKKNKKEEPFAENGSKNVQGSANRQPGKNKLSNRACYLAIFSTSLLLITLYFNGSIKRSAAGQQAIESSISQELAPGVQLLYNDNEKNMRQLDFQVDASDAADKTKLYIWDYGAEDGDVVQVFVNNKAVTNKITIEHRPYIVNVPTNGTVQIKGIRDGRGGGITYAVYCEFNQTSYFNVAPKNGCNTYTFER